MPIACDSNSLIDGAKCIDAMIPPGMQLAVQTYLLATIAGGSTDPNTLLAQASAFQSIPGVMLTQIQVSLLCNLLNK